MDLIEVINFDDVDIWFKSDSELSKLIETSKQNIGYWRKKGEIPIKYHKKIIDEIKDRKFIQEIKERRKNNKNDTKKYLYKNYITHELDKLIKEFPDIDKNVFNELIKKESVIHFIDEFSTNIVNVISDIESDILRKKQNDDCKKTQ